ncbi:isochorismatase family cysteine hydrolase [Clostridium septicum]|uniref:Cysteine hydrolase n=1 Tax=Clostridium septicum TaxID=1504 RepID=A0A9N7PKP6_CLOSE|nr:isochorismatase family cysteine hydrolase [Clostridium septicum]AYE32987.1 cysteine hydrolase [Clostridium septicum]MDU1314202.1 isochorismatase family cysteine hydrolase [Clostridium septicum]QAS61145.1 cysteine hydrolase [Clostridium septicum]UEC19497.1 cysteine hydrolase [Clostridium septicum]USR99550.1 cysteine hydrolase [Clostridium septicum]
MFQTIERIQEEINSIKKITLDEIKGKKALIIVDMVKGFYNIGPLASSRVSKVINPISILANKFENDEKIFFIDSHTKNSVEFKSYPIHCVKESVEEELIDEIKVISKLTKSKIIKKNSINGFHSIEFKNWLENNMDIDTFVITGVCTDICVETFALTLSTYFHELNVEKNIIVPMNMVETYDFGNHNGDLMNLITFFKLKSNGIKVVKSI